MKYQLKKKDIDAQQFIPEQKPWPPKVEEGGMEGRNNMPRYYVPVEGGIAAIVSGDYIIDGEVAVQVVKAPEFESKYELVESK